MRPGDVSEVEELKQFLCRKRDGTCLHSNCKLTLSVTPFKLILEAMES
jgi:hypothetical protein